MSMGGLRPLSLNTLVITFATEVPYSVLSWTIATLSVLTPVAFMSLRKSLYILIYLGEVRSDRRDAEEPFEAALCEVCRYRLAIQKWNSILLGNRTRRERDTRLVGAGERDHLLFGNQPQRLVLSGCRAALVIGEDNLYLGAAETGQAGVLCQREITQLRMGVVDDIQRGFDRGLGVDAGARGVAAQWKDSADLDRLVLGRSIARQDNGKRGGAKQPEDVSKLHIDVSESTTRCQALKPREYGGVAAASSFFWPLSIACPVGIGNQAQDPTITFEVRQARRKVS